MKNIENKNELLKLITPVRLQAYGTESSDILLDRCIYNVKISATFYPALAFVENSLKNSICNAIDKLICKDWLVKEINQQKLLSDKEYTKLIEAKNKIKKANKKITNNRLISELTFGFWVHLCTKSYKPKFWDKKGFFETVFPNYVQEKGLRKIAPIQNDLLAILRLRNRIFHHEMIINRNQTPQEQYQLVLNILHLLSADVEKLLNSISRFQDIIIQKP